VNRLSASTLAEVRGAVRPAYDRQQAAAIVHLGVGAFARAHVATYADDLLCAGVPAMIRGVSLRSPRAERALAPQDGWYSVTTREPSVAPATRVIGSIGSVSTGVVAAVEAVADPGVALVTLTVTEKGYELDGPGSAPAVLAAALDERRRRGGDDVVVASLDNVLDNGAVLRGEVLRAAGDAAGWIADHVAFPCSVVDRMVPATTDADLDEVAAALGVRDEAAVIGEAHRSWVVESDERLSALEQVGVELVSDIQPYQQRKLWLLNGPHSAIAYAGLLAGHDTIAASATDPVIDEFVRRLVDDVLAVAPLAGVEPRSFAETSLRRFVNPALGHRCTQVAADGSRKLVQRLLPVMDHRAEQGLGVDRFATVVAIWLAAVTQAHVRGTALPSIDDPVRSLDGLGSGFTAHADAVRDAYARLVRTGVDALEAAA
jgi:fructuronate reductase